MQDLDSALDDIARVREQLAASSRFQGFAPPIVALTGAMAFALAGWQSTTKQEGLLSWILLGAVCVLLIGTEAIVRARKMHHSMADRLLNTTLQRFMPTAMAGAIAGLVILAKGPEHAVLLPGIWQLLIGVGIFAVLGNLPKEMIWAAAFYFVAGTISLALGAEIETPSPWLMGLPFGFGQLLVATVLYLASHEKSHD